MLGHHDQRPVGAGHEQPLAHLIERDPARVRAQVPTVEDLTGVRVDRRDLAGPTEHHVDEPVATLDAATRLHALLEQDVGVVARWREIGRASWRESGAMPGGAGGWRE